MAARLREKFTNEIRPSLGDKFGRKNVNSLPKLDKIVLNMGVGSATQDKKDLADASEAM